MVQISRAAAGRQRPNPRNVSRNAARSFRRYSALLNQVRLDQSTDSGHRLTRNYTLLSAD